MDTFPDIYGPLDEAWPRTYQTIGFAVQSDPRDGLALGCYTNLINMGPDGMKRSYAATAYYLPCRQMSKLDSTDWSAYREDPSHKDLL
jgi:choline dehydrogenase